MRNNLLFEDAEIQVVHRPGSSPFTLVTFADLTARPAPGFFWGKAPAEHLDLDCIGLVAKRENWYPDTSVEACASAVRGASQPVRLGYGYSMGGYGALRHGRRLGLARALAVAPQASIDPSDVPGDTRYARFFRPGLHAAMRVRADDLADWTAVLADPYDREDGAQLASLPADPRLRRIVVPFMGHWVLWLLTGTAVLGDALARLHAADEAGLRRLIKRQRPASGIWHARLGLAAMSRDHPGVAERLILRATELGAQPAMEEQAVALFDRAHRLRTQGRREDAGQAVAAATAMLPSDSPIFARVGQLLLDKDPAAAELLLRRASAAEGDNGHVLFDLSHLVAARDPRAAIPDAERAVALLPADAEAVAWLGHLRLVSKDAVGAERCFRAALAIDDGLAHAHFGLSHALGTQRRMRDAVAAIQQATARLPDHPDLAARSRELRALRLRARLRKAGPPGLWLYAAWAWGRKQVGARRPRAGRVVALLPLPVLLLANCAGGSPNGDKVVAARAQAGADLVQAGQVVRLAEALLRSSDARLPASIAPVLNEAANGLLQDGLALKNATAVPRDAPAGLQLALPSLRALAAGYTAAGPSQAVQAGKAQGYVDAFVSAASFYNLDAQAAGLGKATLPGR